MGYSFLRLRQTGYAHPAKALPLKAIVTKNALSSGVYSYYTTELLKMSNKLPSSPKDIFTLPTLATQSERCKITKLRCSVSVAQRLAELGLTEGVTVDVLRVAPLNDPIEIAVRGYRLCLRKELAKQIVVEKDDDR